MLLGTPILIGASASAVYISLFRVIFSLTLYDNFPDS